MASKLDVWNLALSKIDVSQTVNSENDVSPAAGVCKRFYDYSRQLVLQKAHWDFATRMSALALVLDQSTVTSQSQLKYPGWRYIYSRPINCLRALAVTTQYGARLNPFTRSWWYDMSQAPQWGPYRPPWRQTIDEVANTPEQSIDILTDQDNAWIVWITDVTNVGLWSQPFLDCVANHLAVAIAGPLAANSSSKATVIKMAELSITTAMMVDLGSSQPDPYPDSPAITARN